MISRYSPESNHSEPDQRVDTTGANAPGLWRSLKHLWCRHSSTIITAKTDGMPAHVVCQSCGWREPVMADTPQGTRTWDSSRDEARYQSEKKRRTAAERRRAKVIAQGAVPATTRTSRTRQKAGTLLHMKRAAGE
jgi:hypothetical protein